MSESLQRGARPEGLLADTRECLEIRNETLRLRVSPAHGASVLDLSVRLQDAWVPLLRPATLPLQRSSYASSFLMLPWSNRIRDGVLEFAGRSYPLRFPEKHAIHGDVRDRIWRVAAEKEHEITLAFDSREHEAVNFPWPFTAQITFALDGARCTWHAQLTNEGDSPMPAGLGFHPYFMRALGEHEENVELEACCTGSYPGDTPLPTGPPIAIKPEDDYSRLRPLGWGLDRCFAGWDGRAILRWPASALRLRVESDAVLRHLVLYTPPGEVFFAVEPVSHANDGFNLFAKGQQGTGVVVLAPGERLSGSVQFTLEP